MDCQEIRNDDEMLIKLVEEISYIYDKKLNLFKDKMARAKAWQSIAKVLEKTPLECEQRWTILRHRYATEKRRMRDQSIKQSFWPLFNAMSFLNAFIMPRNLRSTWNMKRQDSINQEDSVGSMSPREIAQHFGDDDDYCGNAKLPIDGISVKTEATDYEVQATLANNRSCAEAHRDVTPNPNESSTPKIAKAEDKIPMLMERFDRNMGDCVERGLNESLDPDLAFGRTVALHLKEINDKKKRNAVKLQIMKALLEDENGFTISTIREMNERPIELRNFVKVCEQRRKYPFLYTLEYELAVKVESHSCKQGTKKANLEKNQNQRVIPYDYNRVVLEKMEGEPDTDYVNASYADSLLKPNAYIVTQGPTEETVTDFWRMVWQEKASCIVMLTKTFDFIKVMCVQYWPANMELEEHYGGITIKVVQEEELANFRIRTFRLYKKEFDAIVEERFLLQFHFTEWHCHNCPFPNALLEFRRRVRAVVGHRIKSNEAGPMVVHCNDGGGRSGVYLSIDANMEFGEEEDCFDVFGYLKKLRQARKGLVENVDQYKFIYDTLEEYVTCGNSWFPVNELSQRLKQKSQKNPMSKLNEYQREYTLICKQTPRFTIGDCAGGHRGDNRKKNRDVLIVPPDNFRPYLTSFQGNNYTDYINAVFVDGYTKPREYIVTEWPMKMTCGEFWSLVYDYECAAIVILCVPPNNSQSFPSFWPEGRTPKKYGPVFTIDHISHNHYTNIKTWVFRINKKIVSLTELMAGVKAPPKTVQLFQLTCWPMGHKVPTSTNSLVELMNMVERWRQRTEYGPVCVVSPDGRSRCGIYCAANACIEQVIQHGEVDIFQAVRTVRRHRPQLIENITEYKYCYDLVLHYVLHYLNKDLKEKK